MHHHQPAGEARGGASELSTYWEVYLARCASVHDASEKMGF